jgi:hypothetical protein
MIWERGANMTICCIVPGHDFLSSRGVPDPWGAPRDPSGCPRCLRLRRRAAAAQNKWQGNADNLKFECRARLKVVVCLRFWGQR